MSEKGAPLDYTNWRRRTWTTASDAAGLSGLRFHDLRSHAATAAVAAGVVVNTTQTRMGHSSVRMTMNIYARATGEYDRNAADAVGELVRPSRTNRAAAQLARSSGRLFVPLT